MYRHFAAIALSIVWSVGTTVAAAPSDPWLGAAFEGDRASLVQLAQSGAKVVRVYRARDAWVLDAAQQLGMKVVLGLWVGHRRHGIALDDAAAVDHIAQEFVQVVRRYRDHPALLAWGIGNEVETDDPDPRLVWGVVDRLAEIVKSEDPDHPTMMVAADTGAEQLHWLAKCCDHVDLLGLNVYAGAVFDLPQRLRAAGIDKPVVISELGPLGQWQAGRKPWGAPVELTSRSKAEFFRDAIRFLRGQPQIRGIFAFVWGAKQEQTATWHGLLLADGSRTEMTDALEREWGRPPAVPAPTIRGIGISADVFKTGAEVSAGIDALSPGGSLLHADWQLYAEAEDLRKGGDAEKPPPRIPVEFEQADARQARFRAPARPGAYRLFVTLHDASGKAATANLPFRVRR